MKIAIASLANIFLHVVINSTIRNHWKLIFISSGLVCHIVYGSIIVFTGLWPKWWEEQQQQFAWCLLYACQHWKHPTQYHLIGAQINLSRKAQFTPFYNKDIRGKKDNMCLVLSRGKGACTPSWVSDCFFTLPKFRKLGHLCGISPECENELMSVLILVM